MQEETGSLDARPQERRVYRLGGGWVFVLIGALCALGAAYSLAFGFAYGNASNVFSGLLVLPSAVACFVLGRVSRVETTPEGLAYHNSGFYTVRAGWEDVEEVARVPFRGVGEVECVVLRRSEVRGWTWVAGAVRRDLRPLTIPLGKGRVTWSDADGLRREVFGRAPHAAG